MNFRTDLALERREAVPHPNDGMLFTESQENGVKITKIEVIDQKGVEQIGKPPGNYITIETGRIEHRPVAEEVLTEAIAKEITKLIPSGAALICGIGNKDITPDALGPKTADMILATRHIDAEFAEELGLLGLRPVSAVSPGTLGQTGIEAGEVFSGIIEKINPEFVIAVDALASRRAERMGTTVQINDTGITPGGGVGNARKELSKATLGIPVISIGIPTVVDAATLISDMSENRVNGGEVGEMVVTVKEIDLLTDRAAKLLSQSINKALQPKIPPKDLIMLTH